MLAVLILLAIVLLVMLAGFLSHIYFLGNRPQEPAGGGPSPAAAAGAAPNSDSPTSSSSSSSAPVPAAVSGATGAASSKLIEPNASSEQTAIKSPKRTVAMAAQKTAGTTETALSSKGASVALLRQPAAGSSIPVPPRGAGSPRAKPTTTLGRPGTKSSILTIPNKSLTSLKSLSSNKSIDTNTSKAISTRSSLEVQRKELALKKKKTKDGATTTARTPEAK